MATENAYWRAVCERRVFEAMSEHYDEAWEIGCWEHGTGQRFAEIAVEAIEKLQRERNPERAERAEAERDELTTLAIQRADARNDAYALLRDARAERDELRVALQHLVNAIEHKEGVKWATSRRLRQARDVLARREGTDDE